MTAPLDLYRRVEVVTELPPHPAPVVSSRDPRPESVSEPSPVRGVAERARVLGWAVRVQYSRGNGVHSTTGRPTALADYWAVRMYRPGWGAYAVRRGASWSSICVWGERRTPFLELGMTELVEWLEQPDREPKWYASISAHRAGQKAQARARARVAPKHAREGMS